MCFSATASFSAAAVTGSIGAATLWRAVATGDRRVIPLASFPLLFALQQLVEGCLWLDLAQPEPGALRPVLVHAFQGYAEVFWPVFAPMAALLIETENWRRALILVCLVVGACLSVYLLSRMIAHPYVASLADAHIAYKNDYRYPTGIEAPYVLATTISLLLSSRRSVQVLAIVILIGFAVAYISFHHSYISVWCFFAAIASVLVYRSISSAYEPRPLATT
ncbi:MAG: hypothetical protein QOI12_3232 [Alphaproteobacteria bacterium]|jgi:hypothetical protein|nr:hypothetical protein [Alphaproteobacteria bacterium]